MIVRQVLMFSPSCVQNVLSPLKLPVLQTCNEKIEKQTQKCGTHNFFWLVGVPRRTADI